MDAPKTQRGTCSFKVIATGKPVLRMELFHHTVPLLDGLTVEFELLSGTTPEQARRLAETVNERIIGVAITKA